MKHGALRFYLPTIAALAVPLYLIPHFNLPQELALLYIIPWEAGLLLYSERIISPELERIEKEEYMKGMTDIPDDTELVINSCKLKNLV